MSTSPPALPPQSRTSLSVLGALGFLVALVLGLRYAGTSGTTGPDAALFAMIDRAEGLTRQWAIVIDFSGEPVGAVVVFAALGLACLLFRRPRTAILLVVSCTVTIALTTGLKPLTGRLIHGEFLSFPSGHTAFLVTIAAVTGLLVVDVRGLGPRAGAWVLLGLVALGALAMGWSQVALRAHYPTDVLAGLGVALAVLPVAGWAIDRVTRADSTSRAAAGEGEPGHG
ncbi:phosphatase PAP2 family protein [Amycolatopsis sp. 195334CR]|uniref:phosphatase PAP2 family protein n=1 Tax=Amycolatopsis sp. 195334CR TaxID=2814588 RepID=UPI001A90C02D|nr:phosphatase PAP2 family protein [Amycolatopsis sp. 195334CR]MBN6040465.1 phosphatase PAP2 family protein [Amycolatopsis sp. 195334CR]